MILPVVPNQGFGPYGALNPYDLWLMVVLISAVSLSGYVAWRLLGGTGPVLLLGALGGLVSSTATTLVYSRGARGKPELEGTAATVILLANLVKLLRILVLIAVMPSILPTLLPVLAAGVAMTVPFAWIVWQKRGEGEALEPPELTNPTDLPVALGFGVAYAAVLLAAALAERHRRDGRRLRGGDGVGAHRRGSDLALILPPLRRREHHGIGRRDDDRGGDRHQCRDQMDSTVKDN